MLNLVLYQPDIPQNFGACLRLSACLGATIHVVEPCGFIFNDAKLRRAGMDYINKASYIRHLNWAAFLEYRTALNSEHRVGYAEPRSGGGCEAAIRASGSNAASIMGVLPVSSPIPSGAERGLDGHVGVIPPSASKIDYRQDHPGRLLLLETDGTTRYTDVTYQRSDYIVLGRESAGTPRELYDQMEMVLTIPMREGVRSLNVAMSAGMITAEACRQQEWRW